MIFFDSHHQRAFNHLCPLSKEFCVPKSFEEFEIKFVGLLHRWVFLNSIFTFCSYQNADFCFAPHCFARLTIFGQVPRRAAEIYAPLSCVIFKNFTCVIINHLNSSPEITIWCARFCDSACPQETFIILMSSRLHACSLR